MLQVQSLTRDYNLTAMWDRDRPSPLPLSEYFSYYSRPGLPSYLETQLIEEEIRAKSIQIELERAQEVRRIQLQEELRRERLAQVELQLEIERQQRKDLEAAREVMEGGVRESLLGRSRRNAQLQASERKLERAREKQDREEASELEWQEREVRIERDLALSKLTKDDQNRRSRVQEDVSRILKRY